MTIADRRPSIRTALLDLIFEAGAAAPGEPMSDEAYFLAQLRAAIQSADSPAGRLRARYGADRGDILCRLYDKFAD